jgi:imidazolonepropionase-like amidohydrolase
MRAALLILLLNLAFVHIVFATDNNFAIRDVRVFDGETTIARTTVLIRDGRIADMGLDLVIPAKTQVLDGRGKTLLPGLIDAHVHVFPGAQQDALRFGVTTELDMFDFGQDIAAWKRQRESLTQTNAADTWAAGIGVTAPGGHPSQFGPPGMTPTLANVNDAKSFIDARVAEGSDYIKVFIENLSEFPGRPPMPTLSRDEACAVIKAAHDDGKMAIVHVQAAWAAKVAIECGADGLAHMIPDSLVDQDVVAAARERHVFILTTAGVWAGASGLDLAQKLAADPRVAPYLSTTQSQSLIVVSKKPNPQFFTNVLENMRRFHAADVDLLAGSDAPNPATAHGAALHEELQILVQAGYTPEQALRAATALPATVFHLGDRGHIAPSYRADLLLVEGDPTSNIADTLSIKGVWKNGYAVDRAPSANPARAAP